ncbi:MAG: TonB-dependent receptor [Bacteroidota bacterium]
MRKYLLFLCIALLPLSMFAQNTFTVSGTVKSDNGEVIPFANVILSKSKYGVTNDKGQFKIENVSSGTYKLTVSFVGYQTLSQSVNVNKNVTVNLVLKEGAENLNDVTVVAKTETRKQAEKVVTISSLDVKQFKNQTLGVEDVLKQSTGVVVRQSGGLGSTLNINLNGLTGQAVRTYYDGMPIELYGGALQLNFIPVDILERVDVYKGIMPVDIGTDALGGGLNMVPITRSTDYLRTSYSVGSFNTHRFTIGGNYNFNDHISASILSFVNYTDNDYEMKNIPNIVENLRPDGTVASITEERIDARRFHDRFRSKFVQGSVRFQDLSWADNLEISALYSQRDNQVQQGTFITGLAVGEAETEATVTVQRLNYEKSFFSKKLKLKYSGLLSQSTDKTRDSTTAFYNWRGDKLVTPNSVGAEIFGLPTARDGDNSGMAHRVSLQYDITDNINIVVSEFNYNVEIEGEDPIGVRVTLNEGTPEEQILDPNTIPSKLRSNVFGAELNSTFLQDKLSTVLFYKNYNYNARSVDFRRQGATEIPFRTVKDNNNGYGLGVKYQITPEMFIRTSYERTLRFPTENEVFGDFAAIVPNFDLKPEQSNNFNLGVRYEKSMNDNSFISVDLSGFLRDQEDLIRVIPFGPENSQFINEAAVESVGFEFSGKYRPIENLTLNGSFTYQQIEISESSDLSSSGGSIGADVPNIPKLFFNLGANYTFNNIFRTDNSLEVSWTYLFVDRFSINEVIDLDTANPAFVIPRQHLNNANISYALPTQNLVFSLGIQNIFNQEIFDNFRIPRPGINYNFKINYSL